MRVPLSWIKDYVDIDDIPIEELAHTITMAGLEVEEIQYVGAPMPQDKGEYHREETKTTGISWDRDKIVVGAVLEVMPHPNADRLVLCRLDDGTQEHTVLTGAPNLQDYKGKGPLEKPLKVAYAKEGAEIYDGHADELQLVTLKRANIRGVESYSMACSEKELGISEAHEGIIILDDDAPVGAPLADYLGTVVFDIAITPNIARNANVLGIAREIAALYNRELKKPSFDFVAEGESIEGQVSIEITNPEINPRFVFGLIKGVEIKPSPYWVQMRLRLAGVRPISNIVDATNYAMLDIGEPLHAFDYDILVERAGGKAPTIITRAAKQGEKLTTLDGEERVLDDFTVLVTDTAGPLALAGLMGGLESEVTGTTRDVLLEGANWNYVNTRQTQSDQKLSSEAAYRFARGVHPEVAPRGLKRGLEFMRQWSGGVVCKGLVDEYPLRHQDPSVTVTPADARRWLGIDLTVEQMADILRRLEFAVEVDGDSLTTTVPDHRLDIDEGVIGKADLMEEIARIYGYENIPETLMADALPPQRNNPSLEVEERIRDILASLGMQEIINYRMTAPEREQRILPPDVPADDRPYIEMANPMSPDRAMLRKSVLASVLEIVEANARIRPHIAVFEIGPIFLSSELGSLPDEFTRLSLALAGPRDLPTWQGADDAAMDFYDLKGVVETLLDGLHIQGLRYEPCENPIYHPGKCARVMLGDKQLGVIGELHPLVQEQYNFGAPVQAGDFYLETILEVIPERYEVSDVASYPPVLEDLAVVVDEALPAVQVEEMILQTGSKMVTGVQLFDVYRGEQIGKGKKSLAYSITYQALDRTLTDKEVAKQRAKIVRRLENELNAKLRM